ncbi:hypothetical protein [Mesorhizobium abyssinicae]|uniref:hypothetical protein n=1 Tax=Mesorhizobium abyssinicae TaxID=1209958 RepID=UPI003393043C
MAANEDAKEKRTIDRKRESAFSMEVGHAGDGAVTGMVSTAEAMFLIKDKSVYAIKMADQIDPDRTNIDIPNTQQLVADSGSESEIVGRTLMTANQLFTKNHFPERKMRDLCITTSLEIMSQLLAAEKIRDAIEADEGREIEAAKEFNRSRIPAVTEVVARANTYVQKIEHALQAVYRLPEFFYGSARIKVLGGWPDSLEKFFVEEYGANDSLTLFARELSPFAHQIRNARHCVEHPSEIQRLIVKDFELGADGVIRRPSIAVLHAKTPIGQTDLVVFLSAWIEGLTNAAESMMIHLADRKHEKIGQFPIAVTIYPEDRRRHKNVRAGYVINISGEWHPLG